MTDRRASLPTSATRRSPSGRRLTAAPCPGGRRRIRPLSAAAAALAVASALVAVAVGPAIAERPSDGRGSVDRPAQGRGEVGKNWTSPVQDVQPSGNQPSRQSRDAQLPADARSRPPIAVQPDVPAGSMSFQP
ncbi:MAG: hypothetical protein ACR2K2_04760 [Mycobacteriales bacterium]